MDYSDFHRQFQKLAPKKKNPLIDRIIPVDKGGQNLDIRIPVIKNFVRQFHRENNLPFKAAVALANDCFKGKITEEVAFGIELVARHKESRSVEFFPRAERWIKFLTNWENCDRLCGQILGKILRENQVLIKEIKKWADDKSPWKRRCAVVSFIPALAQEGRSGQYKKSKFIKPCLEICLKLGQDPAPYVQKAIGWPVREITKWGGEKITFAWLKKNKNNLTSFVFHSSLEKFPKKTKMELKSLK
ncbi:MAG: hypothetical protein A2231_06030 [Candidatus Firestonebacteria bacterium RIFOXYA2_FULL_40_8]|nr:MAG: hypothetical protein A2231_06030 [Candidatus Firestonebacteria bacterium RIFOXYA2_FULL_40_8]